MDTNQRYQFVNRAYEVWFRCSRDEILGKSVSELLGETAYHIAAPNIKRAQTGQITTYEAEIPYPVGKKHISATFIPDFGPNAQVKGHYGLVTDITDRKRAEEVATALIISESTVKSHVNRILSKLGVNDRTQAVIVAVKRGIVSL